MRTTLLNTLKSKIVDQMSRLGRKKKSYIFGMIASFMMFGSLQGNAQCVISLDTAPTITIGTDPDNVCSVNYTLNDATLSGCLNTTTISVDVDGVGALFGQGFNFAVGTYTITYTENEGSTFVTQTLIVEDDDAPIVTGCPADQTGVTNADGTGDCLATVTWAPPSVSDNCPGVTLSLSVVDIDGNVVAGAAVGGQYSADLSPYTATYTATDVQGNTNATCTFSITVSDNEDPVVTCPTDVTGLSCGEDIPTEFNVSNGTDFAALTGASLSDNCDATSDLDVSYSDSGSQTSCAGGTITRTYTITDDASNAVTCQMTFTWDADTTAPAVTGTITDSTVVGCTASDAPDAETTVAGLEGLTGDLMIEDDCTADGDLMVSSSDASAAGTGSVLVVVTRTYTVKDACDNSSVDIVHTINVEADDSGLAIVAPNDISIEACQADDMTVTAGNAGFAYSETSVTLTSGDVTTFLALEGASITGPCEYTVTYIDSKTGTCPEVVTRTYTVTDSGSSLTDSQTITVEDTTAPEVTGTIDDTAVEGCDASDAPAAVTTVDGLLSLGDGSLIGLMISDACSGASIINNNGDLTVTSSDVSTGTCPLVITRTYVVSDACGNESEDIVHTITVDDTTAPTFTQPDDITIFKDANCEYDASVSVTGDVEDESENCDSGSTAVGTLIITGVFDGTLTNGLPKGVELYVANDIADLSVYGVGSANNGGGTDGQEFTFPSVSASAGTYIYVSSEASGFTTYFGFAPDYTSSGAMGINGDDAIELFQDGNVIDVFGDISGSNESWDYENGWAYRNSATGPDGSAFSLGSWSFGPWAVPIPVGTFQPVTISSLEASFTDAVSDGSCEGEQVITRTWTLTDACNNTTSHNQIITATDNTAPVVTGTIADTTIEGCGASDAPAAETTVAGLEGLGLSIADACTADGDLTVASSDASTGTCPVVVTRTYTVTDDCNNTSVNIVHTINVDDNTAPAVTGTITATTVEGCDATVAPAAETTVEGLEGLTGDLMISDACTEGEGLELFASGETQDNGSFNDNVRLTFADQNAFPVLDNPTGFQSITTYEDVNGTWVYIDGTGLTNFDYRGQTLSLSGQYWINEWDMANALKFVVDYTTLDGTELTSTYYLEGGSTTEASDNFYYNNLTVTSSDAITGTCPLVIERTYVVTDACANASEDIVHTITVEDTMNPTASNPADINVECFSNIPDPDVTVVTDEADNCDGDPTVAWVSDDITSVTCDGAEVTVTRTYSVTDCSGNSITVTQAINVDDTMDPTASNPADISVECFSDIPAADITVVTDEADNCDGDPTVAFVSDDITSATCDGAVVTVTRTYSVTDCSGNSITVTQTINVDDTMNPTASNPAAISVQCFSDIPAADITVVTDEADNCDGDLTVAFVSDNITSAVCDGAVVTVTRTYSVTDCSGNSINVTQAINVADTTSPTGTAPANLTYQCIDDVLVADADDVIDEMDNCDGTVTVAVADTNNGGAGCSSDPYIVTRTYTLTDCSGNSTELTQTITVVDDTVPTYDDPDGLPVSFSQDVASGECNFDYFVGIPNASDNCDDDVSVTLTATDADNNVLTVQTINTATAVVTLPVGINNLTLTSVDDCGNETAHSWTATLSDNIDPEISCPSNITVTLTEDVPDPYANYFVFQIAGGILGDNCTINQSTFDMISEVTVDDAGGSCVDTVKRVYYIEDVSGNSSTCEQLIIVNDEIPPVISDVSDITVECGGSTDPSATGEPTASDNGGTPVVTYADVSDLSGCGGYTGTITRTWTATDLCDNVATSVQVITIEDNTSPVMPESCTDIARLLDETTGTYTLTEADMIEMTAGVTDVCTAAFTYTANVTEFDCSSTAAPIEVTVTVTDPCGNSSSCAAIVTITETTPPVAVCNDITVNLDATGNYELTDADKDAISLGTTDNCVDFTRDYSQVTFDCDDVANSVTLTVTYTDNSGNSSTCTMEVTVEDNIAPTFTCVGDQAFGTSADGTSGDCVYSVTDASLDPTMAADNCGVASVTHDYNAGGTTLLGEDFPLGTTTVVWTISDVNGNSHTCTYDVVVTDDEDPTFTCVGDQAFGTSEDGTSGDCVYSVTDASLDPTMAADNCGLASVTHDYNAGGTTLLGEDFPVGTTTVVWTIEDDNGRTNTCTYDIVVTDDENPTFTCVGDQAFTTSADGTSGDCLYTVTDASLDPTMAADNCGVASVTHDYNAGGTTLSGEDFPVGTTTVVWTISDVNGNSHTCIYDVVVTDDEDPTFTCVGDQAFGTSEDGTSGDCLYTVTDASLDPTMAADNCGVASVTHDYNAGGTTLLGEDFPVGTTTVVWTVTDLAGLTTTCTIEIVITDDEAPTIDCSAIDVTQDADAGACTYTVVGTEFDPTFADNCSATIENDFNNGASLAGEDFPVGTTAVVWTATDPAGLTATCTIEIVITDVEAPVISCLDDFDYNLVDPNDCFADIDTSIVDILDACTSEADMSLTIMVQLETSPGTFAAPAAETISIVHNPATDEFDITATNLRTGLNLVTLTAEDENGNSTTCTFYITVNDLFGPVINSCPADITVTAGEGECEVAVSWTPPAISDPCDAFTFTASHNPNDLFAVDSTTTVTYVAMDPAGNVTTCSFDITVEGDCPLDIDLRAQYSLQGNTYNVGDFKDQVVRVRNIGADDSEGVISVFVSGLTAFDVVFDPNMTVANILIGTTTVNNQDWTTTVLAGGVLYTSSVVIPAGSESKIGLSTEALVAGQDGNLSISILNNSGGDNDNTNNTANKFLVISLN